MKNIFIVIFVALFCSPCFAESTDEKKGVEIMQEVDRRDTGFGDSSADIKMILKSSSGGETLRSLRIDTLEVAGDGNKSLTIFDSPRDVKGTAFLSFTHALKPDEQWLYLPALKRIKRISSTNKSGPFVGSEFAFEDLTSFEVPKYKYKYLRDEKVNDKDSFVIELYPQYEESGYTRQVTWIDKERYIPLKVEYYDRKNALLKTLESKGYQQYLGQYWRADEALMTNHQTGKSTLLQSENYKFKTGLTDRDFDQSTLQRAR